MKLKVVSREYKLLLDHREFLDRRAGLATYRAEVERLARPARLEGDFGAPAKRTLSFLDTPDLTLRRLGLILRHRSTDETSELTLKCRSEDRYFVAGTDVSETEGLKARRKLEEDIAAPFISRFSLSNTVETPGPTTWGAAAQVFPILATLRLDDRPVSPDVVLRPVNGLEVYERVFTGPVLQFSDRVNKGKKTRATVALILWSDGKEGRPLVAEFSYRLKDQDEHYSRDLALAARGFFERLQRHDWTAPRGTTKTQFAFGDLGES